MVPACIYGSGSFSAAFLAVPNSLSNPYLRTGHCGQAARISSIEPRMPFQKIILVLVDDCNSSRQVAFSDLGQAKQVFRGILPTRNHDVGDFLLKSNNHNLPITHVGTCFFTLWINHCGPVVLWCHKPRVFFYAEDSDHCLGEGVWPERS